PAVEPSLQTQKPTVPPIQVQQLPTLPSPAQTHRPPTAAQAPSPPPVENFLMPMPQGWKQVAAGEYYNVHIVQYAPEGQAPDKAEEMLRSLVFSYVREAPLETFMGQATRLPDGECEDVTTTPI